MPTKHEMENVSLLFSVEINSKIPAIGTDIVEVSHSVEYDSSG